MGHIPEVEPFFDLATNTISYVVADPDAGVCSIIDPVLDYDIERSVVTYGNARALIDYIHKKDYQVDWILETHVHADHLSSAQYLKARLGGKIGMSSAIVDVQKVFGDIFDEGDAFKRDGSQFDTLFRDGDTFMIGNIPGYVLHTPGHTPADNTYIIGDTAFVGDTIFMPDFGTARCDFPGGDAATLYTSVQKIFSLPDSMRVFMCHDYLPHGRNTYAWETTIGAQKRQNVHIKEETPQHAFVALRTTRDASLPIPKLIIPAIQVNMRAGTYHTHPDTGKVHIKYPVLPIKSQPPT